MLRECSQIEMACSRINWDGLDLLWNWARALFPVPKIIIWVLFLLILVGLWIWESSWTAFGRMVGFTAIAAGTLLDVPSLIKAFW